MINTIIMSNGILNRVGYVTSAFCLFVLIITLATCAVTTNQTFKLITAIPVNCFSPELLLVVMLVYYNMLQIQGQWEDKVGL